MRPSDRPAARRLSIDAPAVRRQVAEAARGAGEVDLPYVVSVTVAAPLGPSTVRAGAPVDPMAEVRDLRSVAYGRHASALGEAVRAPDAVDARPGTLHILARDRDTGVLVGSLRLVPRRDGPLPLEASTALPADLAGPDVAEAGRLCVRPGYRPAGAPPVGAVLLKSGYLTARRAGVRAVVVCARPDLAPLYLRVGFTAEHGGRTFPLVDLAGAPHLLLALRLGVDDVRMIDSGDLFPRFVLDVRHAGISLDELGPAVSSV